MPDYDDRSIKYECITVNKFLYLFFNQLHQEMTHSTSIRTDLARRRAHSAREIDNIFRLFKDMVRTTVVNTSPRANAHQPRGGFPSMPYSDSENPPPFAPITG